MISGMENDSKNRYQTFEELYSYCYRVASTVGLVCIEIYGYDDKRPRNMQSLGAYSCNSSILSEI